MRAFVTGSHGFLGTHLCDRLRADGVEVTTYDRKEGHDTLASEHLVTRMLDVRPDCVYHFAALADVSRALKQVHQQVNQNFLATLNVLEAMRQVEVRRIVFPSSAVVYGDIQDGFERWAQRNTSVAESDISRQTSVYGAMKLASEALIEAYCVGYGMRADIFRLVSLVGTGYRHGNLLDFYYRLKADPTRLELRGSPTQEKYYCDVDDFIDAVRLVDATDHQGAEIWNVSAHEPNPIQDSIDVVCAVLGITPTIDGDRARWPGDQPQTRLDTGKLTRLGWWPRRSVEATMWETVRWFVEAQV